MDGAAQVVKSYFDQMLDIDIPVVSGTEPETGDIYLQAGGSADELGEEGYMLTIGDYVTILSPTETGMTYGGASITQILYQDEGMDNAPRGTARDYPKYEVRAGMIDVGRMYIPLEYLEEMTVYMSWFKMNETHVHINDYWSGSGYSAFRLESEVYPEIVAEDGYYTKADYRQYQKDMKKYGIDVITEIDTPYHSECFRDIEGVQMLSTGYLDITTDEARTANQEIIENLIDEYLDGPDPVIQSEYFHIGTDEYSKQYGEQMRAWTDHFINYVNDKGYQARLWGSLGTNGFNGTTPVSNDAVMNLWAPYWADVHEMYDAGYDIINTYGGWLYIVPSGNAGYPDRLNVENLYNNFEVNNFQSGRNPLGETIMPVAHPQTKGAEFCLWNDMTSFKTGFSWFDVYDRFKDGVALVAEKTWFGEKQEDQTYEEFAQRVSALEDKVPNANPGRVVDSESENVASYHFTADGSDSTANGYDAVLTDVTVENGAAEVSEGGSITLPFDSIGYPYTVSVKMNLDTIHENTALFSGSDGTVYADIDGAGKLGFKRGDYRFSFDYEMPANEWVTLTFVCDQTNTTLYVNGESMGTAKLMDATIGGRAQASGTMIMTFEKILGSVAGSVDDLEIYNYAMTEEEIGESLHIASRDNLALNKEVEVSSLEVSDGRFTADLAVDGIVSGTSRVSFGKTADEQWLLVDLGEVKTISDFVLNYESQAPKYKIQVSEDGETYTDVYSFEDQSLASTPGGTPGVQEVTIDPVNARYVKYVQLQRWHHTGNGQSYSGSLYEFEVYAAPNAELREYARAALDELTQYESGTHNGNIDEAFYNSLKETLENYLDMTEEGEEQISVSDLLQYKQNILDQQAEIPGHVLTVPQDAVDAYNAADALSARDYTSASYQEFREKLGQISLEGLDTSEAVDAAVRAVEEAVAVLVKVDNTALKDAVAAAEAIDLDDYQETGRQEFEDALAQAKAVLDSPESQDAIDAAAEALNKAADALVPIDAPEEPSESAGKKTLEYFLNKAKGFVEDGSVDSCVESVRKLFAEAVAEGEAVMADENAAREEVTNAAAKLMLAIQALDLKAGDKTDLEMAAELGDMVDLSKYVEAGQAEFTEALAKAKEVLADGDAFQDDVDSAWDALVEAIRNLRLKADKSVLQDLISRTADLDLTGYTEESASIFRAALAAANDVLADETLSEDDQAKVDEAVSVLQAAYNELEKARGEDEIPGGSGAGDAQNADGAGGNQNGTNGAGRSEGGGPGTAESSKAAKTRDAVPIAAAGMMLVISAAAAAAVLRKKEGK